MSNQTAAASASASVSNSATHEVITMSTSFDYGMDSINSIARAYDEKAHGPLCKRPAAIGEVCTAGIYDVLASSGKSLFEKPAKGSKADKDAFGRLMNKAQERWELAAAMKTKVGYTAPASDWMPATYQEEVTSVTPRSSIDLSGLNLDRSVLNFTVRLNQWGNPDAASRKALATAKAFYNAASVRAGMQIKLAGLPKFEVAPEFDYGAINTDRVARKWQRTIRRAMNRQLFTLTNVLGLVTRLHAKVTRTRKGFGTPTTTASATGTKRMNNSRYINQKLARATRKSRQRRNGALKQVARYATTEQRRDARRERATKLAAKLERRRIVKEQIAAQRAANLAKLGVKQRQVFVKGVRQAPITRAQQSAALRGNHDGVYYTNGVEVPTPKAVVKRQRAIARKDREALSPAIRNRRFAAENNRKFQRVCKYAAGRALFRGCTEVVERKVVPVEAPEVPILETTPLQPLEEYIRDEWYDIEDLEEEEMFLRMLAGTVVLDYPKEDVDRLIKNDHWFSGYLHEAVFQQDMRAAQEKAQFKSCGAAAAGFVPGEGKTFPFVCYVSSVDNKLRTFEVQAEAIMANAKAKYGAGNMTMCLNTEFIADDNWLNNLIEEPAAPQTGFTLVNPGDDLEDELDELLFSGGFGSNRDGYVWIDVVDNETKEQKRLLVHHHNEVTNEADWRHLWDECDLLCCCMPEYLPEDVRAKHILPQASGYICLETRFDHVFCWEHKSTNRVDAYLAYCAQYGVDPVDQCGDAYVEGEEHLLGFSLSDLSQEEHDFHGLRVKNNGKIACIGTNTMMLDWDIPDAAHVSDACVTIKTREDAYQIMRDWVKANPGFFFRVYNTPGGVRAFVLSHTFKTSNTHDFVKTNRFMRFDMKCDEFYVGYTLQAAADTWWARISPKWDRIARGKEDYVARHVFDIGMPWNIKPQHMANVLLHDAAIQASTMLDTPKTSIMLVGLPGCGKSTMAKQIVSQDSDYVIVSSDQCRAKLYGSENILGDWETVQKAVRIEFWQARKQGKYVVYDACNLTPDTRDWVMRSMCGTYWSALVNMMSADQCLVQQLQRTKQVPAKAIYGMERSYKLPRQSEGLLGVSYFGNNNAMKKAEKQAAQFMAAAKAKYGAGDLQMSLNSTPADNNSATKKAEEALQQGNLETNSSSLTKEDSMINQIENCFGGAITKAVSVGNTLHNEETLGYALGFAMVYVTEEGHVVHGNVNLPIRNNFSSNQWAKYGAPLENNNKTLNFSSLVTPSKDYPVISVRATNAHAAVRQALVFLSQDWHRPSMLVGKEKPELQPNLWFPGANGDVKPSYVVEGKTVKERLSDELLATRGNVHTAMVLNSEYSDNYGNVVEAAGGLNLQVGRNIIFVIADVSHYIGLDKGQAVLFNVRKEGGAVVGAEGLVRGAFTSNTGAYYGKSVAFTRMITNNMRLYTINDFGGVSSQADWVNNVPSNTKQLLFPVGVTKALANAFFGGSDLVKEDKGTFAPFAEDAFYRYEYTEEHHKLMNMLDMRPMDARVFVSNTKVSSKKNVDKKVYVKSRAITAPAAAPTVTAPVAEEVQDVVVNLPTIEVGEDTTTAVVTEAPAEVTTEVAAVDLGDTSVESRPIESVEVVEPVVTLGAYAQELAAYNKAVNRRWITKQFAEVDHNAFKQGQPWAEMDQVMGLGDGNVRIAADAKHLACFAVQRYLAALTGVGCFDTIDFSGYEWTVDHVAAIVEILRSYSATPAGKEMLAHWEVTSGTNEVLSIYQQRFDFIEGLGVVDSRGRLFKNLLEVVYTIDEEKGTRVFSCTQCINSVGNFLRLVYYGFLPLFATSKLDQIERVGANLKTLMNVAPDLFPMTSDEIMGDNAMVLWAEANAWAPIGRNEDAPYAPFMHIKAFKKYAFVNCAGAMAQRLTTIYNGAIKSVKMTGGEMGQSWVSHALDNWSMVSSFNKGCAFNATGFFTDIPVLAKHAPMIYAQLKAQINAQCVKAGAPLEVVAAALKMSVDDLLATMVVNNNQKATKGTKRILLRACNTIQSGNVVDFSNKPKLQALLAGGHGSKPRDTKWADRVHPDFYSVKTGSKLLYQTGHAEGTLLKVALMLTGVAPAGEAIFIGDPDKAPHGFNDKTEQAAAVLADRCVVKEDGPVNVLAGHVKKIAEAPITMDFPGCVLHGVDYKIVEETIRGVSYIKYVPSTPVMVYGNGVSTICGVKTDDSLNPVKAVQHERRNGDGVLEWVRYHIAPSLSTKKELELEWKVTWRESDAKIRSVIAKAQLLYADKSFLVNGLNRFASTDLVDVVYPNDVVKADTMVSMVGTIGATLVYNPDCVHPTFVAMRELAMDINEEVGGRRHLDYLVEDSTAVAANPKYRKLSGMFFNHFKTTLWSNWQQLESGDFGPAMLRLYEDYAALSISEDLENAAKEPKDRKPKKSTWVELKDSELDFLAAAGFARKDGKFLGDLRVFVDNKDVHNENTNIFVFSFKDGKVSSIKQRCLSLMGKGNCPIYDVVMYERSTNKEAVSVNPSGQMDVNVRSMKRIADAAGQNDSGFAEVLMARQAENGKQLSMMHAKFLTLMLCNGLSKAIPAAKVLKLGSWVRKEDQKEDTFEQDPVAVETVRQLLQNVDFTSPNHFGELCSLLQGYIIEIESSRTKTESVSLGEGNFDTETYRPACQVWTPFLYTLNGLNAENNSHSTLSGFFRDYLFAILDGKQPTLLPAQLIGMLESFANSEAVRKFISGDAAINGKVLSLPCCPTQVYLLTEGGDEWKETARVVKNCGHDLRNVPTWDEYLEHGEDVWDTLEREEIFSGHGRNPLADGANQRIVKLPCNGKTLKSFFYSPSNLYKQEYENGAAIGKPQLVVPYPYFQMVSVVAHTGMNKGDNDGDPTFIVIYTYKSEVEKQALRAMLTTFDFAWKYCEDSVGGKGQMAARGAYLGDHLAAPKASKKTAVYFQDSWLALTLDEGELAGAAVLPAKVFNENNYRALLMQNTFVGVAYRVYRIAEALVDLIRGMPKELFDMNTLPACLHWCLADDAAEVVKAVTELYEIILGATDDDGWDMWKNFYEPASQGKITDYFGVIPFGEVITDPAKAAKAVQVDHVALHREATQRLAPIMHDMGANSKYADRVAYCLWFTSVLAKVQKNPDTMLTGEAGPKRYFEILLMAALMSVEVGRGKWAGFNAGTLNAVTTEKKAASHKRITHLLGNVLKKPGLESFYATWAVKSHTMLTLLQMMDNTILGDLVTGRLVVGEETFNASYVLTDETLAFYQERLAKRVGDIQAPEVVIDIVAEEDLNMPLPDFNEGIVVMQDEDDLSYLDTYEDYDDGYPGPSEDDFGGAGINDTPPDFGDDGGAAADVDINSEPPTDLDSGHTPEANAELNCEPPVVYEEEIMENNLPPEVPQPMGHEVPEEVEINGEPPEDAAQGYALLNEVETESIAAAPAVETPVEVNTSVAAVVMDDEDPNLEPPEDAAEGYANLNAVVDSAPALAASDIETLDVTVYFYLGDCYLAIDSNGNKYELRTSSCNPGGGIFVSTESKVTFAVDASVYTNIEVPADYKKYVGAITFIHEGYEESEKEVEGNCNPAHDLKGEDWSGKLEVYRKEVDSYVCEEDGAYEVCDDLAGITANNIAWVEGVLTNDKIPAAYQSQVSSYLRELVGSTAPAAEKEVSPAPISDKEDILAAILAETKSVKDEVAALKSALAHQEAEDKAIAAAKAELAKIKAEREALKGKLRPEYLAEVYGARPITPVVEETKQDKPDEEDGGAPVVTKKPDPKPPAPPAAKAEPKAAKQEAPVAKREINTTEKPNQILFNSKVGPKAFSNFYIAKFEYNRHSYITAEAAYQLAKVANPDEATLAKFGQLKGAEAKTAGRTLNMRPDWDKVKDQVMHNVLLAKFSTPELRTILLNTGDAELVHLVTWNDLYWGRNPQGKGLNRMGEILMQVRGELLAAPVAEKKVAPAPTKPTVNTKPATTVIYVAGSVKDNRGGWAIRSEDGAIVKTGHGCPESKATPDMVTLRAVVEALKAATAVQGKVRIYLPNKNILVGILGGYKNRTTNVELWKEFEKARAVFKSRPAFMSGSCEKTKALAVAATAPCERCGDKQEVATEKKPWDVSDLEVAPIRKRVADLFVENYPYSEFVENADVKPLPNETIRDYVARGGEEALSMVVSECSIFEIFWGCVKVKASLEEYFEYLWDTNFIQHISGLYPDIELFDVVEEFNKELVIAQQELERKGTRIWDHALDLLPDESEFVLGYNGLRGMAKQYPWIADATVEEFWDCCRFAIYNADYRLGDECSASITEDVRNLMYASWMHLARTGEVVEIECDWLDDANHADFGYWVYSSALAKKQNSKEKTTQDTSMTVTNEASAKKLQGQKRIIPPANPTPAGEITVNTTARSTFDRSVVTLPVSAQSTPCQTKFFELACTGKDIFLSGAPGTGKTYATEQIARHWLSLGDKVIITATTGRAVMNLGSMFDSDELAGLGTINSVLKLGIGFDEEKRWSTGASAWSWANTLVSKGSMDSQLASLLKGKDGRGVRFIIDEVSMLDARLLWVIINILRAHNPAIQILLVGDGNQLQPVSPKEPATPFWKAPVFQGCNVKVAAPIDEFTVVNLVTNVRQADDVALKEALDHLAHTNELTGVLVDRLEGCLNGTLVPPADVDCTHIRYNNLTVKNINDAHTEALDAPKRTYRAVISDNTKSGYAYPSWINDFSPISAVMVLGEGMPVKLRKNRKNDENTLEASNGSRGIITKLEKDAVWVKFENGKILKVEPHTFDGSKDLNGNSKGTFTQLPLHPDYATTGHSCQGLTITNAVVIGLYEERRVFKNKRPVTREDGSVKTYKLSISDAEWLLVACSRVQRADQIFFDVEDPNTLNLAVGSMGNKDRSYFTWLEERSLK